MPSDARRRVTLGDVARRAGLSTTTVSDALSGSGRVTQSTRDKVAKIAAELGYSPNTAARHLKGGRAGALGLYVPDNLGSLNYYLRFSFGVVEQAYRSGYEVVLLSGAALHQGGRLPRVDGTIVVDPKVGDPALEALLTLGIPIVTGEAFGGDKSGLAGSVVPNHRQSVQRLMDHLRAGGARKPALLIPKPQYEWARAIRAGYKGWCRRNDTTATIVDLEFTDPPHIVAAAATDLLRADRSIDSLICGPDGSALAVPAVATALRRTLRKDLLYASCIDSPAMALSEPAVTSIDLRPHNFGISCAELMVDVIEQRATPFLTRPFDTELVIRDSSVRATTATRNDRETRRRQPRLR